MAAPLSALADRLDEVPPFPAVAAYVLRMTGDDRTGGAELARVISSDTALTARLIRVSNSAFYGYARRISNVREATILLGFNQVRQIALSASLMAQYGDGKDDAGGWFDTNLFWAHSLLVAMTAEVIARRTGVCRPENAFTAGILHDIGRLALRWLAPVEFGLAVAAAAAGEMTLDDAEREITGYAHNDLGHDLATRWQFPPALAEAIQRHPNHALVPSTDGLAGVVAQADRLALHFGYFSGFDVPAFEPPLMEPDLAAMDALAGGVPSIARRATTFIEGMAGSSGRRHSAAA